MASSLKHLVRQGTRATSFGTSSKGGSVSMDKPIPVSNATGNMQKRHGYQIDGQRRW